MRNSGYDIEWKQQSEGFMTELIFEVREDEIAGGYVASALGTGIHTQGENIEELRHNVKEAVACHFDRAKDAPKIILASITKPSLTTGC